MWNKLKQILAGNRLLAIGIAGAAVVGVLAAAYFADFAAPAVSPANPPQEVSQTVQQEEPPKETTASEPDQAAEEPTKEQTEEKPEGKNETFVKRILRLLTRQKNPVSGESDGTSENGDGEESASPGGSTTRKYKVTFVTDGGSALSPQQVDAGTPIQTLATPYREGSIFLGWYYDAAQTSAVESGAVVNRDLTLYASYLEEAPLEALEQSTFASALNVDKAFHLTVVTEDNTMNADAVLAGIKAENLTDPEQKNFLLVTGGSGTFTIRGCNPYEEGVNLPAQEGFAQGASFRISLTDSRLSFQGQPESVREYHITTAKEEVQNLTLQGDVIYLPVEQLRNLTNNGHAVETLRIALYQADQNGNVSPAELTTGTFEYDGQLNPGDIVTVYAGVRPDSRTRETPTEQLGDVGYIEITGVEGHTYTYQNAEAEDVLFTPDMLPVSVLADLDEDAGNQSITVRTSVFDYSDDVYENIDLDSRTTVDVGDFLMFYQGEFGQDTGAVDSYGEITEVVYHENDTVTVAYENRTWDYVQTAMEIYTRQTMSGEEMLEGVDTEAIEAQIEQQALDSGFAEEAARYLASMALATENFTRLSETTSLEDYKVTLEDGTPISPEELQLMDNSIQADFELEKGYPKASIGIHPKHFDGVEGTNAAGQGLSVSLEIKAKLTIGKRGSENQIVILLSGTFVEEVGIDMGLSSKAIWKVWGIFPYIAEYRVTANVDALNYTGIEVNATMTTMTSDDDGQEGDGEDISDTIKSLLESAKEGEEEGSEETKNKLVKRYSEMLKAESDFIKIVDQNITEKEKQLPPGLPIIAVGFSLDFVVQMDASVSVGFDFEYITGKRYTFAIDVFGAKVQCDTLTLIEEKYEFSFYAMGRLAVRAGLEMEFKVGLFSTKLDSVGVTAQAGAYTKLWGYFYYELHYTASQGRSQQYSGALLIEVGVYLEAGLNAQVLDGTFSKEMTVVEKEWPLYTVGRADNILDFATAQEEMPNIQLKQHVRSVEIPDSVFSLTYLDLKYGQERQAVYNDYYDAAKEQSESNRKNFEITMTNEKFSYDPQTNTISVHPAEEDKKLEGEMVITWVNYPLAFSSKPIQRRISLYWDNVRDGYVIVPYTNGGSYVPIINAKFESKVTAPAAPEKTGYQFEGWYSDAELTTPFVFPEQMPAEDFNIYAKWSERTDTPYRVEHYQEQLLSGQYELVEAEDFTGTTNQFVTPEVKQYTGYNAPAAQQLKILPDGSAVLRYYYSLQWHRVTFEPGEVGGEAVTYDLKYGGTVTAPKMSAKGYTFTGWDKTVASTMKEDDVTYTAQWKKDPDTPYRVEYYVQRADGSYELRKLLEETGFTGATLTAEDLRKRPVDGEQHTADEAYLSEGAVTFGAMTVHGMICNAGTAEIEPGGSTIIKIKYSRVAYRLTLDYGDGKRVEQSILYGAPVSIPEPLRTGYRFIGWSTDGETVTSPITTMGAADVTYTALWEPISYTVAFEKGHDGATGKMQTMQFTYGTAQNLTENVFTREHYTFAGWAMQPGGSVVFADGARVENLTDKQGKRITLYAVWKPRTYSITYSHCETAQHTNPETYTVESAAILLSDPVQLAYNFEGWYDNAEGTGEAITRMETAGGGNRTLYAKWSAKTDIPYQVQHYQETLEGGWALVETERLTGSVETPVTPAVRDYPGFASPQAAQQTIAADGSTVIRYEYPRREYTLTLNADPGTLPEEGANTITAKFGAPLALPVPVREGYGFSGWYHGDSKFSESRMPAEDLTLDARWVEGLYSYTVCHSLQNVDGNGYTLVETVTETAAMDSQVEAPIKQYTGFTPPSEPQSITIGTDESQNTVQYFYTRNQYQLTWNLDGGSAEGYTAGLVYYGAGITAPVPVKEGHSYQWDTAPAAEMPAEDLTYTALWTPNTYTVSFDGNGGTITAGSAATRTLTFGSTYGELAVMEKPGYTFEGWFDAREGRNPVTAQTAVAIAANHTLYARFAPICYTITYQGVAGAANPNPETYSIETGGLTLAAATREGYTFEGWYETQDFSTAEVKVLPKGSEGDRTYYAKWKENSYTVIFHANNGSTDSNRQTFAYTERKALAANSYQKAGYRFAGWSPDGAAAEAAYADRQTVSKLTPAANGEVHLYAVWQPVTYDIVYENMEGAVNAADNPTSFSAEQPVITLHDPQGKPGYTFGGWYTDASLEQQVSGVLTLNALHTWRFYAKWTPNPYTITFDSGLGDSVPTETLLMTYDTPANLTPIRDITVFSKPGYTFQGWSAVKGGPVVYADGACVNNLAEQGNVTLYAVWELNVFSIRYDAGVGAISHVNPESYSIEDGDVTLNPPAARDGYQFLGWYDGETRVSEIVKGTQKDYALTAKWAHGGYFTITLGQAASSGENLTKQTYLVTRTLPEGTVATPNPQHVYFRTVNGTAYGTTVGYSAAQDKYHFKHVGGEDVYLTFGPTDFELSFAVEEWTTEVHEADAAASFATVGTNRHYQVELYKVVDTVGGCQGELGETASCKKILSTRKGNFLTTTLYQWHSYPLRIDEVKVTDKGYTKNTRWNVTGTEYLNQSMTSNYAKYRDKTAKNLGFYIQMDVREENDGYQWAQFNYGNSYHSAGTLAEYHFAIKDGSKGTSWRNGMTLPSNGETQDDIRFNAGGDCLVRNNWTIAQKSGTTYYAVVDLDKSINFGFDASGNGDDDWRYKNLYVNFKVYDNRAPQQVGLAPMAFGWYQKGDSIAITVLYDEVIDDASNISLGAIEGLPITNAVWTGGTGTNALTFTATLTAEFEVTPNVNYAILASRPVTGTVKDILGNQ